jgi:hypothetical protein
MLLVTLMSGCGGGGGPGVQDILDEVLGSPSHQAAAIEDMDGDGMADIVTVSHILDSNEAFLNVFPRRAGGRFAPAVQTRLGTGTTRRVADVVIDDLDMDGLPDAVVAHLGLTSAGTTPGREISVMLKRGFGAGDFEAYESFVVGDNPQRIAVGDLDMDGLPDIAVAARGGTSVLIQNGGDPGRFFAPIRIDAGRAWDVAIGDVDNDGLPDVLSAGDFGVRLLVNQLNDPGNFVIAGTWSTLTGPTGVALNDFNGDGRLDFAIAFSVTDSFDRAGTAYRLQDGVADGEFGAEVEVPYAGTRTLGSPMSEDLDGNGFADLIVPVFNGSSNVSLAVQMARADGFDPVTTFRSSEELGALAAAVGQLGPDDVADVVLAFGLSGVFVHYGEAPGSFGEAVKIGE